MKFLVFPIFQGFTRYTETFWNTWNKIANQIDKFYKKTETLCQKRPVWSLYEWFSSETRAQTLVGEWWDGEWYMKGKDDFYGYCRDFCDTDIKCDNSGKAQLLQHAKKEKHKQATKHVRSNNQAKLLVTASAPSTSSSSSSNRTSGAIVISFNYNDASLTVEIYWLAKMASCNFSLRSADHIGDTF